MLCPSASTKLLTFANTFDEEATYKDFRQTLTTKVANTEHEHQIYSFCTDYASKLLRRELDKVSNVANPGWLDPDNCNCTFHLTYDLPCPHMMASRNSLGLLPITIDLIPTRWRKMSHSQTKQSSTSKTEAAKRRMSSSNTSNDTSSFTFDKGK